MITALCLNPCIDRTVEIPRFTYGGMNRVASVRDDASGKGVNVAVACRQIGLNASCIGLLGREKGDRIVGRLLDSGCGQAFVPVDGAVRTNLKVLDRETGVITEINEPGPAVSAGQAEELAELAVEWARKSDWLVLTGSMPPGCPDGLYGRIIGRVRDKTRCRCLLDTEGEKFRMGLAARPDMVKPNRYELEMLHGHALPSVADVHEAAQALVREGVGVVAVSLGGDGAYVTDGAQSYFSPALSVPVRSATGAGDSMVAGYLKAFWEGLSLRDAFVSGVAAASASVMTEGTRLIDAAAYRELLSRVRPERL